MQQRPLARPRLVLHVHVGVERHERPVREPPERVDLGERHVVLDEEPRQPREDRDELVEGRAGHADRRDHLLGLELRERQEVREVPSPDVVGVLFRDLLDVDAAEVAEQHHGALAGAVPHDAGVVLVLDLGLLVDEHAARRVPVDLESQDMAGVALGLGRGVGELHASRLHAAAREDLRLDHDGPADVLRDRARLLRRLCEAELRHRDPGAPDDVPRLVLEEPHGRATLAD